MEQKWIPVSERLPEDGITVNVTWINKNPESYYASIKDIPFTDTAVYYNGNWYWWSSTCVDYLKEYGKNEWNLVDKDIDIVAWMPLPEPYIPDTPQNEPEQGGASWQNAMLSKFLNRRGKSND